MQAISIALRKRSERHRNIDAFLVLKEHPLSLLHRARYQFRGQIAEHLRGHYLAHAKARYEELRDCRGEKTLVAEPGVAFAVLPEKRLPASQCGTAYLNSVFQYPGKLNKEEGHLATEFDGLENLRCWYRNADKGEFSLQGYWRAKFNPDFIAFAKSGMIAVLEWKGADRTSNEDTRYKEGLGNDWAALDPDWRYFRVTGESDVQEILKEVARL